MKISSRGEYGLLALLDIARNSDSGPVQVYQIAERQGIPKQYLDQLMLALKNARLVASVRGRQGGYVLAKSPSSITLFDIVSALEGPLGNQNFLPARSRRKNTARNVLNGLWQQLHAHTERILKAKTLADLRDECAAIESEITYEI